MQVKDQSLKLPEDFEVFISLNLGMRNPRRLSRMHEKSCKFQQRLPCLEKGQIAASMG